MTKMAVTTNNSDILFTKKMKIATKEVHSMSDALINAKLGIALTSTRVWAEGLLVFYEIFKWLENAMDDPPHEYIKKLDIEGMRRTHLFENDLEYYLGKEWKKNYVVRESVQNYIKHLEELKKDDPVLIVAYIFHLYMGLLSGGQILRRKRALLQKLKFNRNHSYEGLDVTEIKGTTVYQVKKKINTVMNGIAEELDEEMKEKIINESKYLFFLNDKMVRSIEGTTEVIVWKLLKLSVFSAAVAFGAIWIKKAFF